MDTNTLLRVLVAVMVACCVVPMLFMRKRSRHAHQDEEPVDGGR